MSYSLWPYGLSLGFSGQKYWSGLPCCPPRIFLTRIRTHIVYASCIAGGFFTTSATWEAQRYRPIIIPLKCLWSIAHYHVVKTLFPYMLELHFSSALCFYINIKKTHYSKVLFYFLPLELLAAYIDQLVFYLIFLYLMTYLTWLSRTGHEFIQREVN